MVSRFQRFLSRLQSKKPQEGVQAVRVGPVGMNKIYYITTHFDPSSGKNILLWSDILVVYRNAIFVQHESRVLPFLKGKDFKTLDPLRIAAIPNVTLELVVDDPMNTRPDNTKAEIDEPNDSTRPNANDFPALNGYPLPNQPTALQEMYYRPPPSNSTTFGNAVTTTSPSFSMFGPPGLHSNTSSRYESFSSSSPYAVDAAQTITRASHGATDVISPSLSQMYKEGYGGTQDYQAAMDWFLDKANQGNVEAQIEIGHLYGSGQGVPQNLEKAMEWYLKAAEQGNADAQCCAGFLYERGQGGVPQDYERAMEWYRKAAEQGNPPAQINIGFMYERGQGVPQDYEMAIEWYLKAAKQGFAQAQTNLGFLYEHGLGTPKNCPKAIEWYLKAAEQGAKAAQMNLGCLYHYGHGVPQDYAKALEWYQKASRQGDTHVLHQIDALKKEAKY
ncbi:hypothetical protein BGX29_004913 [Mortierella sp. GBA35]|nr:hypothetical protein BGX29_004913 [Mortierella sp. GBA35]